MNLEDAFLRALLPDPVVVLGQRCERLLFGHEVLLRRVGNFFAEVGGPADPNLEGQTFTAVFILTHSYKDGSSELENDAEIRKKFAEWRRNLPKGLDVLPEAIKLKSFLNGCRSLPIFRPTRRGKPSDTVETPMLAILLHHMTTEQGFSVEEALETPYALTYWLYMVHLEKKGAGKIHSEQLENEESSIREKMIALGMKPLNRKAMQ
jgi:hypothetical protein